MVFLSFIAKGAVSLYSQTKISENKTFDQVTGILRYTNFDFL